MLLTSVLTVSMRVLLYSVKCVGSDTYWCIVWHVWKSVIFLVFLSDWCNRFILKSPNNTTLLHHEKQLKISVKGFVNMSTLSHGGLYAVPTSYFIPFTFTHNHIWSTSGSGGWCGIRTVIPRRMLKPTPSPHERIVVGQEYDATDSQAPMKRGHLHPPSTTSQLLPWYQRRVGPLQLWIHHGVYLTSPRLINLT